MPAFSLLTFNCYGIPAPGTSSRLRTLAHHLDAQPVTVACLQEIHTHPYRKLMLQATKAYHATAFEPFFHVPKGGLLTLATIPIEASEFILYRERGLWFTPALADWILHKGMLITRMSVAGLPVVVINTHLTANYMGNWGRGNAYAEHEHHQLMQLAGVVQAQTADALVIVAGDFNIPRGSWLYDSFMGESRLIDTLAGEMQPTNRVPRGFPKRYAAPIDYALFRMPPLPGCHVTSRLCFGDPVELTNGRRAYLSDHLGVELSLSWEEAQGERAE